MDRQTDDFTAFVAGCEQQLRGTALLLTGDPAQADDLVVAALARTHRRWRRLSTPADALADTRTALVTAALGGSRLSAAGGTIGTLDGPDVDRPPGDLDPGDRRWLAALAALGPTARAVVVLRLVEGQDEETVARLLGRSPSVVADALDTAVQTLGGLLDPESEPGPAPVTAPSTGTPSTSTWAPGPRTDGDPDGDPDAAFRRPGTPTPPAGAAAGPAAADSRLTPAGSTPTGPTITGSAPARSTPADSTPADSTPSDSTPAGTAPAGSAPAADDDPWAIYRRPA
jgi:DNA-directed RNA polymerase specialized sigma24 family protein